MIKNILIQFINDLSVPVFTELNSGHINSTYLAECKSGKYVLQRINGLVFPDSFKVIKNAVVVSEHLAKKTPDKVLHYLRTKDGNYYYIDENGDYWRCYKYVEKAITYSSTDDLEIIREVGTAYGEFARNLLDFDVKNLEKTNEDFHDTEKRFEEAKRIFGLKTVAENNENSTKFDGGIDKDNESTDNGITDIESTDIKAKELFDAYLEMEEDAIRLCKFKKAGFLPLRVTHNDTKLNNVLISEETKKYSAVIDLDTVMIGLIAYDYGDAIRSIAGTGKRDEHDLSKVKFDKEKAKVFSDGYLAEIGKFLEKEELDTLKYGSVAMTLELGIRYLVDYVSGNKVFKVSYPDENYYRARRLLKLAKEMI